MKRALYIPQPSMRLLLAEDWTFDLEYSWRSSDLWRACGGPAVSYAGSPKHPVTLPAGTTLILTRIRIVKGGGQYNVVGFQVAAGGCPANRQLEKGKFLAKLEDVNRIVWEDGLEEEATESTPLLEYDPEDE
jgi:hypothetical protein